MDLLSALIKDSKAIADAVLTPYASGNRVYDVRITRPGALPTYDRDTRQFINPEDELIYRGPARIKPISGGASLNSGDELIEASGAAFSINATDNYPRVDDLVTVIRDAASVAGHVADRVFTITDVQVAGHFSFGFEFTAVGAAPSRRTES